MSTPHVAGLVSILKTYDPSLTQDQTLQLLQNFPKSVQSDRPLANSVDTFGLFTALNNVEEENEEISEEVVIEEEVEQEVSPSQSSSVTLPLPPKKEDSPSYVAPSVGETSEILPRIIDFGETEELIGINDADSSIEEIDIEEVLEATKHGAAKKPEVQLFDENGDIQEDTTFINNFEGEERTGIEV